MEVYRRMKNTFDAFRFGSDYPSEEALLSLRQMLNKNVFFERKKKKTAEFSMVNNTYTNSVLNFYFFCALRKTIMIHGREGRALSSMEPSQQYRAKQIIIEQIY